MITMTVLVEIDVDPTGFTPEELRVDAEAYVADHLTRGQPVVYRAIQDGHVRVRSSAGAPPVRIVERELKEEGTW